METNGRKVVIIGGGIAAFAPRCMHKNADTRAESWKCTTCWRLAMSWRPRRLHFDRPLSSRNAHWLFAAITRMRTRSGASCSTLQTVNLPSSIIVRFGRMETEDGDFLAIPTDVDRLETEFLARAPQDAEQIRRLASPSGVSASSKCPIPARVG